MKLAGNQASSTRAPDKQVSCARTDFHVLVGPTRKPPKVKCRPVIAMRLTACFTKMPTPFASEQAFDKDCPCRYVDWTDLIRILKPKVFIPDDIVGQN